MRLGIIADDLTGANDTGVQFARRGARTLVPLDWHDLRSLSRRADVQLLTPATGPWRPAWRPRPARRGGGRCAGGCRGGLQKIDSTFRGNVGQNSTRS
jgi:uncharacterized protein YgbK (DUF1537 family)